MKQEKLIIFDWGGVIESHRNGEYNIYDAIINIVKRLTEKDIDDSNILKLWVDCDNINNSKISEVNNIEDIKYWFNKLKVNFGFNCTFEEFVKVYKEEYAKVYFYKDVVDYVHSLKDKCKIGILSNLGYLDKDRINMHVNLKEFDYTWLSFELECRKPDDIIYEKVEKSLNIDNSSILFIDDKKSNIESAKKRGWSTCLAYGYELDKIKNCVEEFLKI